MEFDWYNIFNKEEFEDTGLVSRKLTLFLEGVGVRDVLITKANTLAITYDDKFMPVMFNDENPYISLEDSYAVYLDEDDNVWLGIAVPEEEEE